MKKISILIFSFLLPVFSFAQTSDGLSDELLKQQEQLFSQYIDGLTDVNTGLPIGIKEQISLKISDPYPRPNQQITATLSSFATNLDKAQISWSINDKLIQKGIGLTNFNFQTADLGKDQKLTVFVEKIEGGVFTDEYRISTSEIDMYYEAQTYVPPFYKGKARFSNQSTVIVYATPRGIGADGKIIPTENYTYKWSVDNKVVQSASGYGKNYYVHTDSLLSEPAKISVYVSSRDGLIEGRGQITVSPTDPKIYIYEENPIYGTIYESAVRGARDLKREEITFRAVPFFFDKSALSRVFSWKMNNIPIAGLGDNGVITFRQQDDLEGTSNISVEVKNNDKIFQAAKNSFSLLFNKENKSQFSF